MILIHTIATHKPRKILNDLATKYGLIITKGNFQKLNINPKHNEALAAKEVTNHCFVKYTTNLNRNTIHNSATPTRYHEWYGQYWQSKKTMYILQYE